MGRQTGVCTDSVSAGIGVGSSAWRDVGMRVRRGRFRVGFILLGARRAYSGDIRAEAKFLERGGVKPAGAVHAMILLKMTHGILRVRVPLFRRVAVIVAFARKRGLNFFDAVGGRGFLNWFPVLASALLAFLRGCRAL